MCAGDVHVDSDIIYPALPNSYKGLDGVGIAKVNQFWDITDPSVNEYLSVRCIALCRPSNVG